MEATATGWRLTSEGRSELPSAALLDVDGEDALLPSTRGVSVIVVVSFVVGFCLTGRRCWTCRTRGRQPHLHFSNPERHQVDRVQARHRRKVISNGKERAVQVAQLRRQRLELGELIAFQDVLEVRQAAVQTYLFSTW